MASPYDFLKNVLSVLSVFVFSNKKSIFAQCNSPLLSYYSHESTFPFTKFQKSLSPTDARSNHFHYDQEEKMMKLLSALLGLMMVAVLLLPTAEAIVTSKPVLTGLQAAIGQTFNKLDGAIYLTEWSGNRIRSFNPTTNITTIVFSSICDGVVNANPQDIAISPNELSLGKSVFYVTCRNGDLFRLAWRIKTILPITYGWTKTRVNPVAQSLGMVHQLQLDGLGYVCKISLSLS